MKKLIATLLILTAGSAGATLSTIGDVTDFGGGDFGLSSGSGSVSDTAVENFLGLSNGTLTGLSTGIATEGSALSYTVDVFAGSIISFDWLWSSNEGNGVSFNDFAFASISVDGAEVLADTFTADGTFGSFSWMAMADGTVTLGIGVMDVNDSVVDSFLDVGNINVPAPATLLLLGLGLVGLGAARRRA